MNAKPDPPPSKSTHASPSYLAALLSYLVPGLGQLYQGRIGKGVLFLVCLYGLFFAGMAQGHWKNVYIPDPDRVERPWNLPRPLANLYHRLQYTGQFWIGVAAWPAIWHYNTFDERLDGRGQDTSLWRTFQRAPREDEINQMQRDGDKTWDLGWVYTVIAGVLNILVIYDAFAGAALAESEIRARTEQTGAPA